LKEKETAETLSLSWNAEKKNQFLSTHKELKKSIQIQGPRQLARSLSWD
jgi:hypothetical protein